MTPYDGFVWRRLAETVRRWREDPRREIAMDVERAGRLAASLTDPFAPDDQRREQLSALIEAALGFGQRSLAEKNMLWPRMAAGLAVVDVILKSSAAQQTPPVRTVGARPADDTLNPGKLPYWLE